MIRHVNLLYLGCRVLILLDLSYLSRFWTQLEAWLSMQQITASGLRPAGSTNRRFSIKRLYDKHSICEELFIKMWYDKCPMDAHGILNRPDVEVTSKKDKEDQLPKIIELDEDARMCHFLYIRDALGDSDDDDDQLAQVEQQGSPSREHLSAATLANRWLHLAGAARSVRPNLHGRSFKFKTGAPSKARASNAAHDATWHAHTEHSVRWEATV
jgi:hypothetical protein